MSEPAQRPNLFFRLVVPAGGLFVVTILALTSTIFGNEEAPMNRWLNAHGGTLITVEVVLLVIVGFLAMAVDRWKTLRQSNPHPARETGDAGPESSLTDSG